jgi:hypothetical protein
MIKRINFFFLLFVIFTTLFLGFTFTVKAQFDDRPFDQCGTWNHDRNVPTERLCVLIGADTQYIHPYTACPSNANACCPANDIPPECGVDDLDEEPDPDEEPEPEEEPGIYDESSEDCGVWFSDAGYGRNICLDWDNKIILNASSCSGRTGECCANDACSNCYQFSSENRASCVRCTDFPEGPTFDDEEECWNALPADNLSQDDDSGESGGSYSICEANLEHNTEALSNCNQCYGAKGIWTAVGCIERDPKSLVSKVLTIGVGLLGGVFLLRILSASFMLTTSQGDVKKTSEAKQIITEAVIGVIFVLFSVSLLQFIVSGILKIPGFGS